MLRDGCRLTGIRTFCKWYVSMYCAQKLEWGGGLIELTSRLNTKLESQGLEPMVSLATDFADGVKLIQVSGREMCGVWMKCVC
jgi:hypothetical protein